MRVVLVHGSFANGPATWAPLEPLAACFTLVVPSRGGYPPNPPLERIDFEQQADELAPLLEDEAYPTSDERRSCGSRRVAAR